MRKILFQLFSSILLLGFFYAGSDKLDLNKYEHNVTIYRDIWGVPHIYGKTDADAAFGLAYAHAEDDFKTIQEVLIALRGKSASIYGKDAAPIDYLVGLLKVWETVDNNYETALSKEVKAVCDGYANGINRYIEKFPSKVEKEIYPVSGKDIIAGFVLRTPLMFEIDWYIRELMKDKKPNFTNYADRNSKYSMYGSNVIAVAPNRSEDNHTRIAINSHQPWEGPVTWYEAHIHSDDGWNISGGLFPGSPVVFKGYNNNLAWSHTVNDPDLVDIYELKINPDDEDQYLMDGEWFSFEKQTLPITVKLFGPIKWTFKRELLWSLHGPVLKTDHGTYAIRYSAMNLIGQVDQWYHMNKSKNLDEFKSAMEMMQIPMFNTMYADKVGNIFYVYNGLIPDRVSGYKWDDILPGDNKDLVWNSYYDFNDLPQILNPESGYLQNCNSSPYLANIGKDNPIKKLPDNSGIETFQTNRAMRANELFSLDNSITKDDFYSYKYDTYYSKNSAMQYALSNFLNDVKTDDPILIEGIELLTNWDLGNQSNNKAAALAQLTFKNLKFDINEYDYDYNAIFDNFIKSVKFLNENFGKIDIPLGDLLLLKRGDIELPLDGAPDVLRAIYSKLDDDRKIAIAGDCFFQMVEWDESGKVSAESIHQYGSATNNKKSLHYSDQAYLFSNMKMKPSFLELDSIKTYLKASYKP